MGIRPASIAGGFRPKLLRRCQRSPHQRLMTLAIETSCDDTSVAILEKGSQDARPVAKLHFHKKVTSNNLSFQGVHPLVSLTSHQQNLANLVNDAVQHLPVQESNRQDADTDSKSHDIEISADSMGIGQRRLPDIISVTRGPGMRANLFTGLDVAKGLAVAWQRPLVGVHHMQAHALTPRLVSALQAYDPQSALQESEPASLKPDFPFLSLLASGGHTMLLHTASLADHVILGSTTDIAVGECLDKVARVVLPTDTIQSAKTTMYGAMLEDFAFSKKLETKSSLSDNSVQSPNPAKNKMAGHTARDYLNHFGHQYGRYEPPINQEEAKKQSITRWGWGFTQPFTKSKGGVKSRTMEMSFSGLLAAAERFVRYQMDPATGKITTMERSADGISIEERKDMAREAMRVAFEQIAARVISGLQQGAHPPGAKPKLVLAGGVAANSFLRYILASTLCMRGYSDTILYFPPIEYCTDNAAMIAWTGLEMYEAGYTDLLSIRAIRKWPFDQLLSPPQEDN